MLGDPLGALRSFSVTIGLHLNETVLDVLEPGASHPVARLRKQAPIRALVAYQLLVGPALADVAALVTPYGAQAPDGAVLGIVNCSGGRTPDADFHPMRRARHTRYDDNPARWRIVQPGLPPLAGQPVGPRGPRSVRRFIDAIEWIGVDLPPTGALVRLALRFSAVGSAGFTVRLPARSARFEVAVDDPRIDRRLVLACVAALAPFAWTPRGELVGSASDLRAGVRVLRRRLPR
ncbi:MAG: hypothetical protein LBQ06_06295 [Frankiaceae bacterium]|jgi:hypothetical protein|nr:hypothetical protein [Frankiaceae bacterium]